MKIIEKIGNKIKDFYAVRKYKRQRNTFENKYNARNDEYVTVLEDYHKLSIKETELRNRLKDCKKEIKELKRIINEDMVPKNKKS